MYPQQQDEVPAAGSSWAVAGSSWQQRQQRGGGWQHWQQWAAPGSNGSSGAVAGSSGVVAAVAAVGRRLAAVAAVGRRLVVVDMKNTSQNCARGAHNWVDELGCCCTGRAVSGVGVGVNCGEVRHGVC